MKPSARPSQGPSRTSSGSPARSKAIATLKKPRVFAALYERDPIAWARDCIEWKPGEFLAPYQEQDLMNLATKQASALVGPRGIGKTCDIGIGVLWFATTSEARGIDWKLITVAGGHKQLRIFTWPEIHKWASRIRWGRMPFPPFNHHDQLQDMALKLRFGEASAFAVDKPALIEGGHASRILVIGDEAKSIPDEIYDSILGMFSTGETYNWYLSTPGPPRGRLYEICSRRKGTENFHDAIVRVSIDDAVKAGRVKREWAEQMERLWGPQSSRYKCHVLGQFAEEDNDGVIALADVERAVERWREWDAKGRAEDPAKEIRFGLDVGDGGDPNAAARRRGWVISDVRTWDADNSDVTGTMQTVGQFAQLAKAERVRAEKAGGPKGTYPKVLLIIDSLGIGAGVYGRLREVNQETEHPVFQLAAFKAGEATDETDSSGELTFANRRSAAWWGAREIFQREPIAIPPDDELIAELVTPRWRQNSSGKILIESKSELRDPKRLGRSTNKADAVIQALYSRVAVSGGLADIRVWGQRESARDPWAMEGFDGTEGVEDFPEGQRRIEDEERRDREGRRDSGF